MWEIIRLFARLAPSPRKRRALRAFLASKSRAADYITAGLSDDSWSRYVAWLGKFGAYLHVLSQDLSLIHI